MFIYLHFAFYSSLIFLLWRTDRKATYFAKANIQLIHELDTKDSLITEIEQASQIILDDFDVLKNQQEKIQLNNSNLLKEIQYLKETQEKINQIHQSQLKDVEKQSRQDALKRSRSVMRGQATEHLAPYMMDDTNPKDCRFMGNPVDYVVFDGLSAVTDKTAKEINQIKFVDIKTGKSTLNTAQRRIRDAINEGKVSFEIINPDKKDNNNV
jgi:predicted Holliday junction resolvase-like endonuclease